MSSYPIVLTDEFCIVTFSCQPTFATFDSAPAPGPMKAGRDWSTNGPIRRTDSGKARWQNMPAMRWTTSHSFVPSASTTPSIARPVPRNSRTMRGLVFHYLARANVPCPLWSIRAHGNADNRVLTRNRHSPILQHNLEDDPMSKHHTPTVRLQLAALVGPAPGSRRRRFFPSPSLRFEC